MKTTPETERRNKIIYELFIERKKQDAKWGEQNHPSVDPILLKRRGGCTPERMCEEYGLPSEARSKRACDEAAKRGELTFAHIITEELCEAVSAPDDEARRGELVQLGACVLQWIEAIDRRKAQKWKKAAAKKKTASKSKLRKV